MLDSDCPLESFYSKVFEPLFLRSRSENTRRLYRTTLRNIGRYLARQPLLSDLNDDTVNRFLDWFRRLPRSPFSVNKERSNLLAIWRFACRKNYLKEWPDVLPDNEPERIPQAWTADEVFRLFASCEQEPGDIAGIPASQWWRILHLVCWDSGERIGAIVGLKWHNADLRSGHLLVPAELRKGGRRDQIYKLADDTILALKDFQHPKRDDIFPWSYCYTYLWKKYESILKRADLPTDRKSKFHRIRKSVASHAEAAGGNATEILGHSQRSVTLAYLDPRIVPRSHAKDYLFRPEKPGNKGFQKPR